MFLQFFYEQTIPEDKIELNWKRRMINKKIVCSNEEKSESEKRKSNMDKYLLLKKY